ncbi:MAG: hypothetical protein AAF085_10425 [Planctomycetota bacterium]
MNSTKNQPTQRRRRCSGGRDARGSAIVLVLVSMVLMAILAASLLQLTRFERIPRSESNIEVVIESVVAEIINQLTDDVLDDAGNYMNTANSAGGFDEPFDFPWTNSAVTGERRPENRNGVAQTNVLGGRIDDTWLATHMPDFGAAPAAGTVYNTGGVAGGTYGAWRKITSLTGMYLGGNLAGNADLTLQAQPEELNVSNLAVPANSDSNLAIAAPGAATILVDADGDGIGDSRWEWAPLRQVGATQYVMAVRIVDLSARADVNVAMGLTDAALADRRAFGDSPVELDASGFVALNSVLAGLNTTTTRNEWERVLRHRILADGSSAYGLIPTYDNNIAVADQRTRRHHWTEGASRVSNTFERNGEVSPGNYDYSSAATFDLINDAFELLQGNGVGSSNTTTIENLMPTFLRRDGGVNSDGQEGTYATGNAPWVAQQDFWELDPRKQMTAFSGASIAAKPARINQAQILKVDVNRAVQTGALGSITAAILQASRASLANLYPHLASTTDLAEQLTANIADYIDNDNTLTTVDDKTGFEALPHITEVYTQRFYNGTVATTADANINRVTWSAPAGSTQGYVIEIANPFVRYNSTWTGRPIRLDNVWISFDGGATTDQLSTLVGGTLELLPDEVIYLYRNAAGNTTNPTDNILDGTSTFYTAVTAGGNYSNIRVAQGPVMPENPTGGEITISLHAALQGQTTPQTGWAYHACNIQVGGDNPGAEDVPAADFTVGTPYQTYIQTHYQGVGEGIRMMTVTPDPADTNGFDENIASLTNPSSNCSHNTSTDGTQMGEALRPNIGDFADSTKTNEPTGFAGLDGQQIVWPDSDRQRMHWIGDILQIPLIGPASRSGASTTIAEHFEAANSSGAVNTSGMDALYLPYQATTPVIHPTVGFGAFNYPQGLFILEQLTTFSPASDGENGDGSNPAGAESVAAPNTDEMLVPGRININTAPEEVLVGLLPFPDEPTRRAVAAAIVERRESMTQANPTTGNGYGMGANNIPGIAYTSAMYEQLATLPNRTVTLANNTTGNYVNTSIDTNDTTFVNGVQIDLNDHETALGTYVTADGVVDDREEQLMLAKWLTEVAETRSDVFAAYIVVQGYPADNFSEGATESARLIVIFSRAGIEGSGDKAVELGRFRIN